MSGVWLSLALIAITAVWGATFTVVKQAVTQYGVVSFLAIRFAVGTLGLLPWAVGRLDRQSITSGSLVGLALAAGYLFQTFGLRWTSATNSGLITGLFVVFAPLWNRALFKVHTPAMVWGAIALSFVGLLLLTGGGAEPLAWGDVLTLGAAAAFALQIVLLGRFGKEHDTFALAGVQVAVAAVVFFLAWPWVDPCVLPPPSVWPAILLTGIVATALGFAVQTFAQKQIPPTRAAVIFALESVFVLVFGYVFAGDRLSAFQLLGAAVMMAAVGLSETAGLLNLPRSPGQTQSTGAEPADTPR